MVPKGSKIIFKNPEERAEKIRQSKLGKKRPPFSEEWRRRLGEATRNRTVSYTHTEATKELLRHILKGKRLSIKSEFKKGIIPWNKGKQLYHLRGENNPNWNGGLRVTHRKIRKSAEYKEWHCHVLRRDDYTCQACGVRGGRLEVDHELPFALYPDLRLEVLNGRTLCRLCHKKTGTWGRPVGTKPYPSLFHPIGVSTGAN